MRPGIKSRRRLVDLLCRAPVTPNCKIQVRAASSYQELLKSVRIKSKPPRSAGRRDISSSDPLANFKLALASKSLDDANKAAAILKDIDASSLIPVTGQVLNLLASRQTTSRSFQMLASPVRLDILENALRSSVPLSETDYASLQWYLRFMTDPFVLFAYSRLLREYATRVPIQRDMIDICLVVAYVHCDNFEQAYDILLRLIHDDSVPIGDLPVDFVLQQLIVKQGAINECIEVTRLLAAKVAQPLKLETWITMLDCALASGSLSPVRFIWQHYFSQQPNKLAPSLLVRMFSLACHNGDIELAEKLALAISSNTALDEPVTPDIAAACLIGVASTNNFDLILSAFNTIEETGVQGLSHKGLLPVGERLSSVEPTPEKLNIRVLDSIGKLAPRTQTLIMNILLDRYLYVWAASGVFKTYQDFTASGVCNDADTYQILLNAAYSLGNSKKLSYEIYQEILRTGVTPTVGIFETIMRCQMVGRNFDSVYYFLREMRRLQIPLRAHLRTSLERQFAFAGDERWRTIFRGDLDTMLEKYGVFPDDEALKQAGSKSMTSGKRYSSIRDMLNTSSFLKGWQLKHVAPFTHKASRSH